MSGKLAAKLPAGSANGLGAISEALVEQPDRIHVVLMLVDCSKISTDTDSGDVIPTVRIRRIEPITDGVDGHRLRQILRRAWERRTGKDVLPIDLEDDINAAFGIDTAPERRAEPGASGE